MQRVKAEIKGITPHPGTPKHPGGQVLLIALTLAYRYVIAAIGRQWGKTEAAKMAILEHYFQPKHAGHRFNAAFCAPTYKRCVEVYEEFVEMMTPKKGGAIGFMASHNKSELKIKLRPVAAPGCEPTKGGTIYFWSLEDHDNVRGPRLDLALLDEAKDIVEQAWTATIRPMLTVRKGHALVIGTPSPDGVGFMWFKKWFLMGKSEQFPNVFSVNFPSEGSPYQDPEELAEQRLMSSRRERRSEFDAEFVDDDAAVFVRLGEAFSLPCRLEGRHEAWLEDLVLDHGRARGEFVLSYDIGRHSDWSWITVFDLATRNQVYAWRGDTVPFEQQLEHLQRIRRIFNDAFVVVDDNGIGDAQAERLALRYGDGMVGRKWNKRTKEADVSRAMSLFERAHWRFLDWQVQKEQFEAYTRIKLPAGGYRYEASSGFHDDAVTAACIMVQQIVFDYVPPETVEPPIRRIDEDGKVCVDFWLEKEERESMVKKLAFWR